MGRVIVVATLLLVYFGLGLLSGLFLGGYLSDAPQLPSAASDVQLPQERPSPYDHITEDQIKVYDNKVEITLEGRRVSWARFAGSNSMDPLLDETANSIEIIPDSTSDVHVGDIVAFSYGNSLIVHRVMETGYDDKGWYALTAGDNTRTLDAGKRRFSDIKYITVAILY